LAFRRAGLLYFGKGLYLYLTPWDTGNAGDPPRNFVFIIRMMLFARLVFTIVYKTRSFFYLTTPPPNIFNHLLSALCFSRVEIAVFRAALLAGVQ